MNLNFNPMKKNCSLLILITILFIGSNKIVAQTSNWVAPESSTNLINPFKGNASATADGKKIFNQMCVLCHGLQGKGNGEAGLSLERKPANFLSLKIINETDGNIFWKITHGKAPMATYEELLTEDQRWKLVNYIRQLEINREKKKK